MTYDERQLNEIMSKLAAYEAGKIELNDIVGALEALIATLRSVPDAVRESLQSGWGKMEDVNADLVEFGPVHGPQVYTDVLRIGIEEIRKTIRSFLAN